MNRDTIRSAMDRLSLLLDYTTPAAGAEKNAAGAGDLVFRTAVRSRYPHNRIVFGAPGTGKSHTIKEDSAQLLAEGGGYERVTFHPDYTYSQFVGSYKPITDDNGGIRYEFVAGPFLRVLTAALANARTEHPRPYLLIIEEINRAKAAAVFGDVFQLLDRDSYGVSDYEIHAGKEMRDCLCRALSIPPEKLAEIRIPNNMFIWASMNSADQGVYPMDTAFKRRWDFDYLGINTNDRLITGSLTLGHGEKARDIGWNRLRKAINERLSVDFHVNEDKLIGPFFLSQSVIASDESGKITDPQRFIAAFKSKVIMYLFEDAAKQIRGKLFSGCDSSRYSAICDAFDSMGIEIFGADFVELYNRTEG